MKIKMKTSNTKVKLRIRKGPNIKLPSLELLEDPEIHQIDNSWIEEKTRIK